MLLFVDLLETLEVPARTYGAILLKYHPYPLRSDADFSQALRNRGYLIVCQCAKQCPELRS